MLYKKASHAWKHLQQHVCDQTTKMTNFIPPPPPEKTKKVLPFLYHFYVEARLPRVWKLGKKCPKMFITSTEFSNKPLMYSFVLYTI